MNILSNRADEPIEAIVTVSVPSINANGDEDTMYKEYYLYVGKVIDIDELKEQFSITGTDIDKLKREGKIRFLKNDSGLKLLDKEDAVFVDSQSLLSRVDMILNKFESLGYETQDDLRKNSVR